MDIGKFISKVKSMRTSQRNYFRYRSNGWLERAKEDERVVDEMIVEYYDEQCKQTRFDF